MSTLATHAIPKSHMRSCYFCQLSHPDGLQASRIRTSIEVPPDAETQAISPLGSRLRTSRSTWQHNLHRFLVPTGGVSHPKKAKTLSQIQVLGFLLSWNMEFGVSPLSLEAKPSHHAHLHPPSPPSHERISSGFNGPLLAAPWTYPLRLLIPY